MGCEAPVTLAPSGRASVADAKSTAAFGDEAKLSCLASALKKGLCSSCDTLIVGRFAQFQETLGCTCSPLPVLIRRLRGPRVGFKPMLSPLAKVGWVRVRPRGACPDQGSSRALCADAQSLGMKLLQAWIELCKDELIADWKLAVAGEQPYKIDP